MVSVRAKAKPATVPNEAEIAERLRAALKKAADHDAAQEAILRTLKKWREGSVPNPEGYVRTVYKNLRASEARKESRQHKPVTSKRRTWPNETALRSLGSH